MNRLPRHLPFAVVSERSWLLRDFPLRSMSSSTQLNRMVVQCWRKDNVNHAFAQR
jgi:hypothetical protein